VPELSSKKAARNLEEDIIMLFSEIKTTQDLGLFLKINPEKFDVFTEPEKNSLIKKMIKSKKNNLGERIIYKIIDPDLKIAIKNLCRQLNTAYIPGELANGFIVGRNTKDNAKQHLNRKKIINIDLNNFFPSITKSMIKKSFLELGCQSEIAEILSAISTINGQLAAGYASSPILSNFIFKEIDNSLAEISNKHKTIYSRYSDDLYFSSNSEIISLEDIEKKLAIYGFRISAQKTRYMNRGKNQYISGLTVSDANAPRIQKRLKRRVRLILHYLNKFGLNSHLEHNHNNINPDIFVRKLRSMIDGINAIEPEIARKFYDQLEELKRQP
jgi:retron-type reverse transcriptase